MNFKQLITKVNPYIILGIIYSFWLLNLLSRSEGLVDDFDVFFNAARRLLLGENIYGEPHFLNLKYFYSPLFASVLSLTLPIDILIVKVIWFALNSILFFRSLYVIQSWVPKLGKKAVLAFFIGLLLTGKIILINYTFNQITIVILWSIVESFYQLKKDKMLLAVLILCLGINIKILPIVMVPYFIFISKKPLKMLLYGIVVLLLSVYLPAIWLGWDYNNMLLVEWGKTLNPVSKIHAVQTYEYGLLDIGALISKYISAEEVYKEPVLNFLSLSDSVVFAIINIVRALILGSVCWFAMKIKRPVYGLHPHVLVASAFMALIPLCFPHQREYSYLMFLPILSYTLIALFQQKFGFSAILFVFFCLLSGFLTWVDFAGQAVVDVFVFYRLITLGMLGMLIFYMVFMYKAHQKSLA